MEVRYNHKLIEIQAQTFWKINKTFNVSLDFKKKKHYCLTMFPYPSGKLHMGHVRNYTVGDIISRFYRLIGKNVLHPIGWDSFGLPAELAAIQHNISPKLWTVNNIKVMKQQLVSLGFSYDWSREISTCNEKYYIWDQWLFIKLYKTGKIYRKKSFVNWCNNDKTVLANEQIINEKCWRCNNKPQLRELNQWFLRIRDFADKLLLDIKYLKDWPVKVTNMQRNWIGKKQGFLVKFDFFITKPVINYNLIKQYDNCVQTCLNTLFIFTSHVALIMGVTYLTISLDHPITKRLSMYNPNIKSFVTNCLKTNYIYKFSNKSHNYNKKGINTYLLLIHPITKKLLPLWITNTISFNNTYNDTSQWHIPGHYAESFYFAKKYNLKIHKFITSILDVKNYFIQNIEYEDFNTKNYIINNFNYLDYESNIFKKLKKSHSCLYHINYKLRDWVISRQRSWGVPIPILFKRDQKLVFKPVKIEKLPITPTETKDNLSNTKYCDIIWEHETDTLDTFFQSSWYYARYACPNVTLKMLDIEKTSYWLPVDIYIGGIEHAILHLMYFRFFNKLLKDINLLNCIEPANKLLCQGMVLSETYCYIDHNNYYHWINPSIIKKNKNPINNKYFFLDNKGREVKFMGLSKMSKSKNNGVDPNVMIDRYGADAIRLFIMFAAPIEMDLIWNEDGLKGTYRFLKKIWNIIYLHINNIFNYKNKIIDDKKNVLSDITKDIWNLLVSTISKVYDDIEHKKSFNTAISHMMKFTNKLNMFVYKNDNDWIIMHKILKNFLLILYPFAPHISFVLWDKLTGKNDIDKKKWPNISYIKPQNNNIKDIIVQINNKFKKKITIPWAMGKEQIENFILNNIIKNNIYNKINKIIWIKDFIVNIIYHKNDNN